MAGHTHPLAIPLLGAIAAGALGSLYWYFGIGGMLLHGAITFAILYGSIVAVVLGIAGIVWCAAKLLAIRGRFFSGRNEEIPGPTPVGGGATRFSE
jgi:hypothetical protein